MQDGGLRDQKAAQNRAQSQLNVSVMLQQLKYALCIANSVGVVLSTMQAAPHLLLGAALLLAEHSFSAIGEDGSKLSKSLGPQNLDGSADCGIPQGLYSKRLSSPVDFSGKTPVSRQLEQQSLLRRQQEV